MSVGLLKDIVDELPRGQALLGLDVGKKTIGLALSNPDQTIATPLETINRTKFTEDVEVFKKVIEEYEIGGFVVGLPLNMDGTEGPRAQSVRDFALELYKSLENPWIALWDERLSTVSVEDTVDNLVEKRKTKAESKSSGLIDKLAAQIILQGSLEYINQNIRHIKHRSL